ncbi:hypothetical protein ADUPG1_013241 [Aduncisulcus paluster]|uniref:CCHC-type domain-containing protein n=1 Tax=Aduncisulcus paluster TaxID=2918883 RepID=A0ABQ5K283_9EUKA|nr:hypothetical protein ADUPG1_013241 [Aduncisulcus paluster]
MAKKRKAKTEAEKKLREKSSGISSMTAHAETPVTPIRREVTLDMEPVTYPTPPKTLDQTDSIMAMLTSIQTQIGTMSRRMEDMEGKYVKMEKELIEAKKERTIVNKTAVKTSSVTEITPIRREVTLDMEPVTYPTPPKTLDQTDSIMAMLTSIQTQIGTMSRRMEDMEGKYVKMEKELIEAKKERTIVNKTAVKTSSVTESSGGSVDCKKSTSAKTSTSHMRKRPMELGEISESNDENSDAGFESTKSPQNVDIGSGHPVVTQSYRKTKDLFECDQSIITQLMPVESPPVLDAFLKENYKTFIRQFKEYKRRGGRLQLSACISDAVAFSVAAITGEVKPSEEVVAATLEHHLGKATDADVLGRLQRLRCPKFSSMADINGYVAKFMDILSSARDFLERRPDLVMEVFEKNLTHPKLRDEVRLLRGEGTEGFGKAVGIVLRKAVIFGHNSDDSKKRKRNSDSGEKSKVCPACGRFGHTRENCWKEHPELRPKNNAKKDHLMKLSDTICSSHQKDRSTIEVEVMVDPIVAKKVRARALIDTGASRSFINPILAKELGIRSKSTSPIEIKYGDTSKECNEICEVFTSIRVGKTKRLTCLPLKPIISDLVGEYDLIIGKNEGEKFGLYKMNAFGIEDVVVDDDDEKSDEYPCFSEEEIREDPTDYVNNEYPNFTRLKELIGQYSELWNLISSNKIYYTVISFNC